MSLNISPPRNRFTFLRSSCVRDYMRACMPVPACHLPHQSRPFLLWHSLPPPSLLQACLGVCMPPPRTLPRLTLERNNLSTPTPTIRPNRPISDLSFTLTASPLGGGSVKVNLRSEIGRCGLIVRVGGRSCVTSHGSLSNAPTSCSLVTALG